MMNLRHVGLPGDLTGIDAEPPPGVTQRGSVLMLHGMMGGAWQFQHLQPQLAAAGYRTLALNYRGHHDSRPVPDLARISVRDYAQDAMLGCDYLGGRPAVVGQSMGGLVALMLAEAGAVSAAVLVCSLPPRRIAWRTSRPTTALRALAASVRRHPIQPHRADLDALVLNGLREDQRAAAFECQVPESSRAAFEIACGRIHVDPRLVTCPVLSITTGNDKLVRPSVGARIARRYHGDRLHFDDAAHYAMVAEPSAAEVSSAIVEWLQAPSSSVAMSTSAEARSLR